MGNSRELNPQELEKEILQFWRSEDINDELIDSRRGGRNYYLARPPFPVKDELSWDELYGNIIYDAWARFMSMRGFNVRNGIGTDPLSLRIEKLALKEEGLRCLKTSLEGHESFSEDLSDRAEVLKEETFDHLQHLGLWTNSEYDYETTSGKFIDSICWTIKELMEKDLLAKKEKPVRWCPECKIPVMGSEKSTREEPRNDPIVKVPLASGKERYFLVEIKDLWKLPASLSLAVNPKMKYSVIKSTTGDGEVEQYVVLQEKAAEMMEKAGRRYTVLNTVDGKKLKGLSFRYPLGEKIPEKVEIDCEHKRRVLGTDEVNEEGTGIEFLVPPYEESHLEIAEENDMNIYDPLRDNGYFDGGPRKNKYSGLSTFQSEEVILDDLRAKGLLFWNEREQRKVEVCDACKSKLIRHRKKEWFFDSERFEEDIGEGLNQIETLPSNKNLKVDDWLVTRDNHWGMAFPIWRCECGKSFIPSERKELADNSDYDVDDLFIPETMKNIEVECPECGKRMDRDDRVITPSLLRAASPWAQIGYPHDEKGYQSWWPGKLMIGSDPREDGLFSANLSLSLSLFDEPSIEKILLKGTIISEIDYKNVKGLVDNQGHDTLRIHLLSDSHLWEDRKIEGDNLQEPHPMIRVLWNLHQFFKDNLRTLDLELEDLVSEPDLERLEVEDRWLCSCLETTKEVSHEYYEHGRIDEAQKVFQDFILEDFAQWYISLARERLGDGKENEENILSAMYRCLKDISKLIFPIAPFIGEKIYLDLNEDEKSAFLSGWPDFEEKYRSLELEDEMKEIRRIVNEIKEIKRREELPEKWPLDEIIYKPKDEESKDLIERYSHVIKDKAKVKIVKILEVGEEWEDSILKVRPNEETIGKSYQQWKSKIATMLQQRSPEEIRKGVEEGEFTMGLEGQIIEIEPEMVEFEKDMPEGYKELSLDGHDIFVNLEVTNQIWEEEMADEIILRLKSMREDMNLAEEDEIDAYISGEDYIIEAVENHMAGIKERSGAREIKVDDEDTAECEYILEWEINGQDVEIGINPLYKTQVLDYFTRLSGVDEQIAETLYEARYTSIEHLKEASASELSGVEGIKRSLARSIINSLKEIESKEELQEEKKPSEKLKAEEEEEKETGEKEMEEEPEEEIEEETEEKMEKEAEEEPEEGLEETEEKLEEEEEETMDRERIQEELPDKISLGSTYLIEEEGTEESFSLLKEVLDMGQQGLCVSRDYPEKIKEEYDLEDVEMIWLSNVDREDVIRPKSLEKLSLALENFLARKGGVILLNGLEYLITNNDFRTVLHLIQSIKDQVAINESILLIPINPTVVEDSQLDLLSGEIDELIEP